MENEMKSISQPGVSNTLRRRTNFGQTVHSQPNLENPEPRAEPIETMTQEGDIFDGECIEDMKKFEPDELFEKYKELGGELEKHLRQLESKNSLLVNVLGQCNNECELLRQQKDFQQKALVELQLKVEHLSSKEQALIQECFEERDFKLQLINEEFQTAFNNNNYIMDTISKMNDILKSDRDDFDRLLTAIVDELKLTETSGRNYIKKMRELLQVYESENTSLNNSIQEIDKELEFTIELFKNNKQIKLEKRTSIEQKKKSLETISDKITENCREIEEYKKKIVEMELNANYLDQNYNEKSEANRNSLNQKRNELEILCNSIVEKKQMLVRNEVEFDDLVEENNRLLSQIDLILAEKEELLKEIEGTTNIVGKLKSQLETERSQCCKMEKLPEVLHVLDEQEVSIKSEKDKTIELTKDKMAGIERLLKELALVEAEDADLSSQITEINKSNAEKKRIVASTDEELTSATLAYENTKNEADRLTALEKELNDLAGEFEAGNQALMLLDKEIERFNKEINETQKKTRDIDIVMNKQNEEKIKKSEEMNIWNESYDVIQEMLEDIVENIEEILKTKESSGKIDELKAELQNVDETLQELQAQKAQNFVSITNSHLFEVDRLKEQIKKLTLTTQAYLNKKEECLKRYKNAVPTIQVECNTNKRIAAQALNKLSEKMKIGMDCLEEMIEFYRHIQEKTHGEDTRATKYLRVCTGINQQLSNPMSQMLKYTGLKNIDLKSPTYKTYRQVFDTFREKFINLFTDQSLTLKDKKDNIVGMAVSIYGKLPNVPRVESPCESLVSSTSTMI
ncbi:interaptin-like isoform X2 [Cimex lectularius]|uniref:Uncharacterized protein n=1 Tax=Cimex lectularius TaxID=79782 RepID=A0A8I6TH16_CIMLE|nr:interaptin-like isoform X2 [Cimex lectularius]